MNHPFLSPPLSFNGEAAAFSDKLPNHARLQSSILAVTMSEDEQDTENSHCQ